jgi:hypothetical protein
MGLQNASVSNALNNRFGTKDTTLSRFGVVYSVILDETHPKIKQSPNDSFDSRIVGCVEFRYQNDFTTNDRDLPLAYPFDKNFVNLPTKNEVVEIIQSNAGPILYKRIGAEPSPNINAQSTLISSVFAPGSTQSPEKTTSDYSKVSQTGITKTNTSGNLKYDGYGKYFKAEKTHKLKLYEGDTLVQSRFGQSIRFSAYNNEKNIYSPVILIRNSQNEISKKQDISTIVEEDINRDGSTIAITSNQYQLPFQPGTVSDKGSSDFETKPNTFKSYPSKLIGDQVLINSGRIILSARNAEMIFYSKKNYGFISDGAMSIDNKLGINVNVNDTIDVKTNDRDIRLVTGTGRIYLGRYGASGDAGAPIQKMVMGGELVKILKDLIDAVTKQQYATPCGPTALGPTNLADFNLIKTKLNQILSNNNYLSR